MGHDPLGYHLKVCPRLKKAIIQSLRMWVCLQPGCRIGRVMKHYIMEAYLVNSDLFVYYLPVAIFWLLLHLYYYHSFIHLLTG